MNRSATRLDELTIRVEFEQFLTRIHTATAAFRRVERERTGDAIFHKALNN